jgi:hypothetical protein
VIAKHSTADERAVEKRTAAGQAVHHQAQLPFETERIAPIDRIVTDVRGQIGITTGELDRILPNESVQAGMVVARPAVPPTASLARKSTPPPMRVVPMRPSAATAGGDRVVRAATSKMLRNGVFGGYRGSPPAIRRDPGGATARRWRASGRGRRGRGRRNHGHDSSDEAPAAPSSRRAPQLQTGGGVASAARGRALQADRFSERRVKEWDSHAGRYETMRAK